MRTNLVKNPSFETNLTGWTWTGGVAIRTNAYGTQMWSGLGLRSGGYMLQATADGTNRYLTVSQVSATDSFAVTPGQWVGVSALVASDIPAPGGVRVDVVCRGTATTYHASGVFQPSSFYAGRRIVYAFQVPATGSTAEVRVQGDSGSATFLAATNRIWADNIIAAVAATEAEALAAVTPYFDGSFPQTDTLEFGWEGAPHASASFEREWGAPVLSDGVTSIVPPLLTDEHESPSRNRVHALLGDAAPDVTLRPMGARTGTLECFCRTRMDALALLDMHRPGGPFTLAGGGPDMGMRYTLAEGQGPRLRREMPFRRWVVTIPYQEVAT